ncbi:hypothetical protein CEUSTIGMA_g1634.t1 [Chlamydomonas eustigma]|uniref:Uncharacterized protein n=1 Tax=Chlamydomonas eustigma TaxID=1157962 RepID=A0A250WTQ2_9CHLO|nr:hypothetical protein CEUSTIGMA_g1634.t1 [Chlamydomonas eustigma]|eukprot:GAX74185.1 hypothetical protein CEUSTIGMA_g1634.t1 [Chlamydomonas eustigma]
MEKPSHDALGVRKSSRPIDSSPLLEKSHAERPSGLFGLLRSPFQAAAKTVRLLASPRESSLAGHSPGPTKHIPQHPPAATQSQNVYQAAKTANSEPSVPPPSDVISQKEQEGWSPSKLESLKYFLSQPPATSHPPASEAAHPRAPASLVTEQDRLPEIRPYLGLKYLLRSGPTESGVPKSWERLQMPLLDERRKTSQAPARAGPSSARYAPYALPPSGANRFNARPPPQLPTPHQQLAVRGRGPLPLTPYPHAPQNESAAPASGHTLVSPAAIPHLTPPGSVPKSLTTAASYALFSGTPPTRAGTPLQQGAGQSNGTPMPRKLFQGPPSLVNTPLTGGGLSAVGMKRGRSEAGSGSVTPLMGSGITNLAEYKRQRQRYSSENRSLLSMGAGGGSASRSVSRTVSPDGSAPVQQQQQQEGLLLAGEDFTTTPALSSPPAKPVTATTDTARRILQTLDNMSKVHDQQLQSPAPTPSNTMPSKGPAGSTPFPRYNAPPPLDRLSPVQLSSPSPSPAMFKTSVQEQKQQKSVFEPLVAEEEAEVVDTQPLLSVAPAAASASALWRHQDVGATQATVYAPPFSFSNQASTPAFTFSASPPVAPAPAPSLLTGNGVKKLPKTGIQVHPPSQHHLVSEADTLTQPAKKVFTFGINTQDETSKALAAVLNDVPVASGIVLPKFVFGDAEVTVTATTPQSIPMGADKISFPAKTYIDMKEQVTAASQIPLPPEEDEQVDAVVYCNEKVVRKEARQAASPHNSNSVETATPASRISHSDKPSEAPAPAVSSGWGASFLAANQAALSSTNQAVAQDIAASQSPAPAASVAAAPAGSGWGAAFLAQNQSQLSQASAAVEAEVEAAKKPASSVAFTFGVTSSSTVQEKAGPTGISAASVEGAAPIQAPLKAPVAASGWDLGFLQKSQAALASASEAVANEIQETQQGGARKEAASPIVSGFGSPFPTTKIDTPSLQTNPAASLLPPFTFGAPSNAATASVSTAAASPAFAFTSPSAPAAETPAPAPFSFGAPTSSAASFAPTSAPAASFSFSSSSSSSMATAAVEPSTAVSTPAASFLFGAAASSSSAFTFGATNISAQTSTTQPSFFGSTPATALPTSEPSTSAFPSTTFTFGASQTASQQAPPVQQQQLNTSTSLFSFGAQPTSQPQAPSFINNPVNPSSPSSLFGQPSAAPSSSSQAWPSNPSQALAATPAFGSPFFQSTTPNAISTPLFGNQLQTDGASIFGNPQSSPAPAFGFGASTPTFMNTPTSPAPNTFGQPGHTPFVFGQANASPPQGSASPLPSFQTQQQPNSFTFGGAPAAPIFGAPTSGFGAVSAPTGFGATPSMPAFGAPFQTAPSAGLGAVGDGANGGGGFTLGTGNSEPTGRRRIKAKRNNG